MVRYTVSYGSIGIIFFISGISIPRQAIVDNCTKFRLHFVVQIISYLVFPFAFLSDIEVFSGVVFGIVSAIVQSGTTKIDQTILVGMVVMGCIPTTISSNVVMTRAAEGNDSVHVQRFESHS
jgi:solute carrier family 10 (sodium/bile acid cotransporter), member 7